MESKHPEGFEWSPEKNETNIAKHGISFEEASEIFERPFLKSRSDRSGEVRWVALGKSATRVVAVIYTERGSRIRIISARAVRSHEREIYEDRCGGAP